MTWNTARHALCALLTAVLILGVAPFAAAESGNPFDVPAPESAPGNLFEGAVVSTVVPAPAPTISPNAGSAADLFNLGTPTPAPAAGADLFTSAEPTSIPGYNPFDPESSAQQAVVPTNTPMYVVTSLALIRRTPSDRAGVMTRAAFGQQLSVTATQDGWARVTSDNGRTGFCRLDQLSSANPNTQSKVMYVQPSRVALARTPERRGGRYRWLSAGETVTMVAIASDGLWARVTDGSNYGYIPTFALDDAPAGQGTPMWCAAASTAVMVNPDSWTQIGSLSLGQGVSLVGYVENDTIAKVRSSSGYVAYCAASALSATNPLSMNAPVYAQVSGRILYRAASESAHAGGVGKNARLTLLGVDNSQYWAVVRYAGKTYYTPYVFVGPNRPGNGSRVVALTQDAQLYRNRTEVAATLPAGTRMYLTGAAGTAAKITTIADAATPVSAGYVMTQYLRGE